MAAILFDKLDWPTSAKAREDLSRRGIGFVSRPIDTHPIDRAGALALARQAARLLVKAGDGALRLAGGAALSEAEAAGHLVHEDGLLRVPVLVVGDLLVRGYTEALYREALGPGPPCADG